jgi:hypothetical protein
MAYIVAGPIVALIGVAAVFFVLRRKSVEKRSMYSSRRNQIEHKVRAARQRTLAPHGHAEKAPEPEPGAALPYAPTQVQPSATYQPSAYEAPPAAPPSAPTAWPQRPAEPPPWEQGPTRAPQPAPEYPSAQPEPVEPFRPAAEPTPMRSSEPVWTPAPRPAEPMPPATPVAPAASATASATAAGAWSVVSSEKESSGEETGSKKKKKDKGLPTGSWQLASGDSPGMDADEPEGKRSNAKLVAIAQYAIFVVGLVMVLIGIVVMVANSHVT